jgi:hypothetical protein
LTSGTCRNKDASDLRGQLRQQPQSTWRCGLEHRNQACRQGSGDGLFLLLLELVSVIAAWLSGSSTNSRLSVAVKSMSSCSD